MGNPTIPMAQKNDRLLKMSEVMERCAVSRSKAYRMVELEGLRHLRIGASVRVRESDLEAFLADCTVE